MSIPQQTEDRATAAHGYPEDEYGYEPPQQRSASMERMPPQNEEAEQCSLGGALMSKTSIGDVIEALAGPSDYYRPAHETIYQAILDLYAKGEPVDPITVADALHRSGKLAQVGGAGYLHTLVNSVPTAADAGHYAGIVAERAVFRRLAEAGTQITQDAYRAEGDAREAVDHAQSALFRVMTEQGQPDALPLSETAQAMIDRLQARKALGNGLRGLSTGFTDLDSLTKGLLGGQLIVIAGRPAMGKTTLGIDLVRECSIANRIPSAFFSLEMSRHELEERVLSAQSRVAHQHITSGDLSEDDWTRIARHMDDLSDSPLFIEDRANLTYMEIAAKARRLKQRHDIRLIVVDYLQLMTAGGRRPETRQQEVADISRNLKLLAKDLDVPVVALSQLNRGPEQRTDKKPMMSDLRESGAIEQDADMVILLHREDAYEKESARAGEADFIVAKHRGGPTATITVAFQGHYSRFVDMART